MPAEGLYKIIAKIYRIIPAGKSEEIEFRRNMGAPLRFFPLGKSARPGYPLQSSGFCKAKSARISASIQDAWTSSNPNGIATSPLRGPLPPQAAEAGKTHGLTPGL
jgi:hypothetical protein